MTFLLSERRAFAVRSFLVTYMGIEPTRISIHDFGERRLIAPASATIEDQQLNRRVEIVIRQKNGRSCRRL